MAHVQMSVHGHVTLNLWSQGNPDQFIDDSQNHTLHNYIHKVYDVSNFVAKHPGGADQIMLGAGRDITVMFDSYHPLDIHK
jgi:hypothetical protein